MFLRFQIKILLSSTTETVALQATGVQLSSQSPFPGLNLELRTSPTGPNMQPCFTLATSAQING